MVACSVRGCKSSSNKKNAQHIKFFKFPKDKKTCKLWIQACDRDENKINLMNGKICSLHFNEESYILKDRLLNIPIEKRHLNPNAIPTEFLPRQFTFWSIDDEIKRKELVDELLQQAELEYVYLLNQLK